MIIVGDIGNTEVKICFFYNGLKKKYLFKTDSLNKKIIRNKFNFLRKKIYLKNAIISSVVPKTFSQIKKIFFNLYKVNCIELKKLNLTRLINIKVNKKEIGSDRLANAISVMSKNKNFIVVDFGTATTFDVIKKNNYLGGVIAPGVTLSLDNLIKKASLIPNIELITVVVFLSGLYLGIRWGGVVGMTSMAIYSGMNPMGSGLSFPPLFAMQIIGMSLTGIIGGLVRPFFFVKQFNVFLISSLAILGFTVTLIYDMLTLIAYPIAAGLGFSGMLAALIKGLGFTLLHEISNAIVFVVSIPRIIKLLKN